MQSKIQFQANLRKVDMKDNISLFVFVRIFIGLVSKQLQKRGFLKINIQTFSRFVDAIQHDRLSVVKEESLPSSSRFCDVQERAKIRT